MIELAIHIAVLLLSHTAVSLLMCLSFVERLTHPERRDPKLDFRRAFPRLADRPRTLRHRVALEVFRLRRKM